MDPIPPLGRIYQLAIQDESQRLSSSDFIRTGDSVLLNVHATPTQKAIVAQSSSGNYEQAPFSTAKGKNNVAFAIQADGQDQKPRYDGQHFFHSNFFDAPYQATSAPAFVSPSGPNFGSPSGPNFGKNKGKYCVYCKRPNHTKDTCWKLHGRPNQKDKKEKESSIHQVMAHSDEKFNQPINNEQFQKLMDALNQLNTADKSASFAGTSFCMTNSIISNNWIIDSGASDHIICNDSFFASVHPKSHSFTTVCLPNGNITTVTKIGTVHLSPSLTLTNVLYVPAFHFNLISVAKLCQDNSCRIEFFPNFCLFQGLSTGKLMGLGKAYQGLYFWLPFPYNLDISSLNKSTLCTAKVSNNTIISHQRLGHSATYPYPKCPVCPLAKQPRAPFPLSTSRTKSIFSLIHLDICGPYHTPHRDGSRYFLTIVDDFCT